MKKVARFFVIAAIIYALFLHFTKYLVYIIDYIRDVTLYWGPTRPFSRFITNYPILSLALLFLLLIFLSQDDKERAKA